MQHIRSHNLHIWASCMHSQKPTENIFIPSRKVTVAVVRKKKKERERERESVWGKALIEHVKNKIREQAIFCFQCYFNKEKVH